MSKEKQVAVQDNSKRYFSVSYKVILVTLIFTAILHRAGLFSIELQRDTLFSFTTISNSYILLVVLITLFMSKNSSKAYDITISLLQPIGIVVILVVGLVYHFILLPQKIVENPNYNVFTYGNIVAHYVVPIATFLSWLFFEEKGKISKCFPFACMVMPLLYFVLASIYGYYGSNILNKESSYVYFFMDFGNLGFIGVMQWVFLILLIILIIAYFIYFLDFSIAKRRRL